MLLFFDIFNYILISNNLCNNISNINQPSIKNTQNLSINIYTFNPKIKKFKKLVICINLSVINKYYYNNILKSKK